jgi:CBS domain-containing protein
MIKVKDIMTRNIITVSPDSKIKDAANLLISKMIASLVVVENNRPIGVISENDLVRAASVKGAKVKDFMSDSFMIITPNTPLSVISKTLRWKKIRRYPIVDNNELVGLITETDIIQTTRDFTRMHQIMQEVILFVFGIATAFFLFYFSPLSLAIFA